MAAMYTKMTATGSSLIVAPRTISKELEAKIAAAVAGVIAKNDLNKLTTKMVRQHVEKEVKVSLTNHKEVLKRLMHQEFRRIKAEKAAKRVVPQPWKIKTRRQCMLKGLHHVYSMLRDQKTGEQAADLQLHAMLALFDVQAVEGFEVGRVASTYMRMLAASWLQTPLSSEWPQNRVPTPSEILQGLYAVYTAERIGVSHPRRVDVLEFLDRTPAVYSAVDFFGWDPTTSTPLSKPSDSPYRLMTTALLQCWFAHSLGTSLGCSFQQLLQHLPLLYPYKSPAEASPEDYHDQAIMISTIVLILADFGKLKCEPELLPHEYFFLRQHLVHHIVRQDVSLMSTMLRALRCFEGSDNLISVRRGLALIILTQRPDGSWKPRGDEDSLSAVFRTSMLAVAALSEVRSQGYAPAIPDLIPLLELNLNAELPSVVLEDEKLKKITAPNTEESTSDSPSGAPNNQDVESSSPHSSSKAPGDAASASEESLEDQVRFHQSMLEKAGDNVKNVSAALAMQVLSTLSGMTLNVDILKNTGVGRTINKLRKHAHEEVAKTATQLVAKWKKNLL